MRWKGGREKMKARELDERRQVEREMKDRKGGSMGGGEAEERKGGSKGRRERGDGKKRERYRG